MRRLGLTALWSLLALGCQRSNAVFTPDEAARICASLAACAPQEFRGSIQMCTTDIAFFPPSPGRLVQSSPPVTVGFEKAWSTIYKCMLDARGDCGRVSACLAPGAASSSCDPAASLQRGVCSGETLSGCTADGQAFAIDCASTGAVCVGVAIIGAPINVCAIGRCPATRAELACRGTVREVCVGEALVLADCAGSGGRCELGTDGGEPRCAGESCSLDFNSRCEGDVAIACSGGLVGRVDCTSNAVARRCEKGRCVATGQECAEEPSACSGPVLTFCQDGFKRELNCVGAGFGGCSAGACVAR